MSATFIVAESNLVHRAVRLRLLPETRWLPEYSCAKVRYALKHLDDAYQVFFQDKQGYPQCKARYRTQDGFTMTDTARMDTRIQRKQRHLARKRQCIRSNDTHHISRTLTDKAHTVVIADLHTQDMTRSAQGTVDAPGHNVKAKAGLNRILRASNGGQWEQRLLYKCGQLVKVPASYTRQTCSHCGCVDKAHTSPVPLRGLRIATQCQSQCGTQHLGET